jgi:hypothetical protein
MIPTFMYKALRYLFIVIAVYQIYLVLFSVPMAYPLIYHLFVIIGCIICERAYSKADREYETETEQMVNKFIFHPKVIYDECDFAMRIIKGNIQAMKKDIMKENDREKLEIMERKWEMFKAQETVLEEQMKLNKKFYDNMVEMDTIEQDLDNYKIVHK